MPKKDNTLRICIDCKVSINKFVQTDHYPLPKIDEIFASFGNCACFCVLDLSGAYQQVKVSEKFQEYLTINTHKGLYRCTRHPFGLSSAPALFQSIIDQILQGIPKVFGYLDDILIGGENLEDCERKLEEVLNRLSENQLKVSEGKCKFFQDKSCLFRSRNMQGGN